MLSVCHQRYFSWYVFFSWSLASAEVPSTLWLIRWTGWWRETCCIKKLQVCWSPWTSGKVKVRDPFRISTLRSPSKSSTEPESWLSLVWKPFSRLSKSQLWSLWGLMHCGRPVWLSTEISGVCKPRLDLLSLGGQNLLGTVLSFILGGDEIFACWSR